MYFFGEEIINMMRREHFDQNERPALTVSIIVPVYNGGEAFHHCTASLAGLIPSPAEMIVVIDGATDESRHVAQTFGARVLDNPSPRGPAYARNQGACAAHGDILFLSMLMSPYRPTRLHRFSAPLLTTLSLLR